MRAAKVGRPVKFEKSRFDIRSFVGDEVIETDIRGAKKLATRCVYMICSGDKKPVYIGRTINSFKRFDVYLYGGCHNKCLEEWLSSNREKAVVFVLICEDIVTNEIRLIKEYSKQLFNLSNGKEHQWYKNAQKSKPWVAKPGVKCPSTILLRRLSGNPERRSLVKEIKDFRATMTEKSRSIFEVDLAMQMSPAFDQEIDKWLSFTKEKLLKTLISCE